MYNKTKLNSGSDSYKLIGGKLLGRKMAQFLHSIYQWIPTHKFLLLQCHWRQSKIAVPSDSENSKITK